MGLLLAGCSSGGGDEPPGRESDTTQPEDSTEQPSAEPTEEPPGDSTGGRTHDGGGGGGFDTAGRVSPNFQGQWPGGVVTLTNISDEAYTGTATFSDCTPGPGRWSTASPAQSVSLPPGEAVPLDFSFPTPDPAPAPIAEHILCVSLSGGDKPLSGAIADPAFVSPEQSEQSEPSSETPSETPSPSESPTDES